MEASDKQEEKETAPASVTDENQAPSSPNDEACLKVWEKKCEEYLNGWRRAQADYQNLVKETTKWREEFVKFANENLILELLPVLDNFQAALNTIVASEQTSPLVIGFNHIKKQLDDFLRDNGVERIKTSGEKFDPLRHEAVEQRATAQAPIDTIIEEKRAGYTLSGKVIQAAKVVVAKHD